MRRDPKHMGSLEARLDVVSSARLILSYDSIWNRPADLWIFCAVRRKTLRGKTPKATDKSFSPLIQQSNPHESAELIYSDQLAFAFFPRKCVESSGALAKATAV